MRNRKRFENRIIGMLLAVAMTVSLVQISPMEVHAQVKTLTLAQAKALAVANSDAIDSIEAKIMNQEAKLKSATKSIALKQKNRSTIRYSPLLNFKFPTDASGSTKYDEAIKPIQIQTQIDILKHQLTDQKIEEYKKVSELFVTIVSKQDRIEFNEKRLASYEKAIAKNKSRLLLGEAKQSDIDTMESKLSEIKTAIANDTTSLETAKKKLSEAINLDVSTTYTFENPYIKSEIPRDVLGDLQQYTLDNDQTYYTACINETEGKVAVNTYSTILKNEFGGKYNTIAPYVNAALSGNKIQKKAFKNDYDNFLKIIDNPWAGTYNIYLLFTVIRIPKEWFKGDVDGIRYIDDDPYAMMDITLEYVDKRLERIQTEKSIQTQVEDQFNTYVSIKKSYSNYTDLVDKAKLQLDRDLASNRIGELTYEEYQSSQDSYEALENDLLQSLADYSNCLIEFDRLTCGGVSAYFSGNGLNTFAAGSGTSYIDEEVAEGAYCYVQPVAQQQAFVMTVVLPDNFSVDISDFELWVDKTQIGDRTPIDGQLRHLWIDTQNTNSTAFVRLYNGDEAICDCDIDPAQYSNPLRIVTNYKVDRLAKDTVGTYIIKNSEAGNFTILTVTINDGEEIAYYRMKLDGKYINGEGKIDVKKELKYLGALSESLDDIEIEYFDKDEKLLFTGYFDTTNLKLKRNLE